MVKFATEIQYSPKVRKWRAFAEIVEPVAQQWHGPPRDSYRQAEQDIDEKLALLDQHLATIRGYRVEIPARPPTVH